MTKPESLPRLRVAIADDHEVFRHGLRQLLELSEDLEVVAEFSTGRAVLNAPDKECWDVLVLDLTLPLVSGFEVLTRLRALRPTLKVLVLSMYSAEHYEARVRRAGAVAFLSKTAPSAQIADAVRAVYRGAVPLLAQPDSPGERLPHERLSAREYQVFMLLAQGRAIGDIAAELDLTPSTVSTHVARVREKLSVQNLAELIRYAFQAGLVGD